MLLILLAIALLVYFAFFSSFFNVKKVEVVGAETLAEAEILSIADVTIDSNLIFQNTAEKGAKLKEAFSRIEDVSVKRAYPDRLVINIKEKQPVMVGVKVGGFLLIDANGEVIDITQDPSKVKAPILTPIVFPAAIEQGQILVESSLRQGLLFVQSVPEEKRYLLNEVKVKNGLISIYPTGDYEVILGDNTNMNKKLNTLETLIEAHVLDRAIAYMDLSVPDRPIIKEQ